MKIYKISFWFLLILFATLLNYLRVNNINYDNEIKNIESQNKKRITSLLLSNTSINRRINDIKCKNIITNDTIKNIFQNSSLIIFLDKFRCSKCQENELRRLDSLKLYFESKGINVLGITSKSQKDVVIRQRKLLKITYPIFWAEDSVFYNLNIIKRFPQILLVSENIVLSNFFPIAKDDEFSKIYYNDIVNRTELHLFRDSYY